MRASLIAPENVRDETFTGGLGPWVSGALHESGLLGWKKLTESVSAVHTLRYRAIARRRRSSAERPPTGGPSASATYA